MTRPVATTFLKLVKMPCAVSGRRYATDDVSESGPTFVWNIRLKSRGGVSEPGLPVAGLGIKDCSSSAASVKSLSSVSVSSPCFFACRGRRVRFQRIAPNCAELRQNCGPSRARAFFFILFAIASASASISPLSSTET